MPVFVAPATWRRLLVFIPVALIAGTGIWLMTALLTANGLNVPEAALLVVFAPTFAWIAFSFWVALIGFVLILTGRHPVTLRPIRPGDGDGTALRTRIALVMPIYNEDAARVFAGLLATCRSLAATGAAAHFDAFLLSDTTRPEIARQEESLWLRARQALGKAPRLFYRRRAANTGRKAGNIGDWVASHGAAYDFMVVLDADSIMSGPTLVRLARVMEDNPQAGIVQTLAVAANRESLFARVLQFAGRLYGPMLAMGQSFWQLGDSNYYGHNAIIRVAAFAAHCELPTLSGRPPLGGEILSHDFVEAALIRRGGWQVWNLPELDGSYEEVPPNLVDYAARDRRWTEGNLQHLRLIGTPGFHWVNRAHLGMGVLAYVASPLWMLFLVLSSAVVIEQAVVGHAYFPSERTLFPIWPEYRPFEKAALLAMTAVILLLPKALALVLVCRDAERRRRFGGGVAVVGSAIAELAFSLLLAPIMMLFQTQFVLNVLAGRSVRWNAQPRDDRSVGWDLAMRRHAGHVAIGLAWLVLIAALAPAYVPWIVPVALGLVLAIPFSVWSSHADAGRAARRAGLFLTPEEIAPPAELVETRRLAAELAPLAAETPSTPAVAMARVAAE